MDNERSTKMNLYSPAKCLRIISATLLACSLSFFCVCVLPYADPWIDRCAGAATPGDRTAGEADEADFSQSVMIGPNKIREGDTIDCEIILRNTGSKRPDYVELTIRTGSPSAMLASGPELSYNVENENSTGGEQ